MFSPSRGYILEISDQVLDYFEDGMVIKSGAIVFDIGANIGVFTNEVVSRTNGNCEIHCFEPINQTYQFLTKNLEILDKKFKDNLLNVTSNCIGLSDQSGELDFTHYSNCPSSSTYTKIGEDAFKLALEGRYKKMSDDEQFYESILLKMGFPWHYLPKKLLLPLLKYNSKRLQRKKIIKCRVITLSDYFSQKEIKKIDLMKVDAEGAELDILKGINKVDWNIIKKLVIEVHDVGNNLSDITDLLEQNNFTIKLTPDKRFNVAGLSIIKLTADHKS